MSRHAGRPDGGALLHVVMFSYGQCGTGCHALTGHLLMGDTTYNHIYHDTGSTGSVTQRLRQHTQPKPDPEDTTGGIEDQPQPSQGPSQQPLPAQATAGRPSSLSPREQPSPSQDYHQPLPAQATASADPSHGMDALRSAVADGLQSPSPAPAADTPTGSLSGTCYTCLRHLFYQASRSV